MVLGTRNGAGSLENTGVSSGGSKAGAGAVGSPRMDSVAGSSLVPEMGSSYNELENHHVEYEHSLFLWAIFNSYVK